LHLPSDNGNGRTKYILKATEKQRVTTIVNVDVMLNATETQLLCYRPSHSATPLRLLTLTSCCRHQSWSPLHHATCMNSKR